MSVSYFRALDYESTHRDPLGSDSSERSLSKSTVNRSIDLNEGLWSKVSDKILQTCKKGEKLTPRDRRTITSTIANYMIDTLEDTTRSTANKIATILCNEYSKSFIDTVGSEEWGSGISTLRMSIYNACLYRKSEQIAKRKRSVNVDSDDEQIKKKKTKIELPRRQCKYGCVDYSPNLPDDENQQSQEEKRRKLQQFFTTDDKDDDEIKKLLDATYPTVRTTLNRKLRNLELIFTEWPFLSKPNVLLDHSSRLLGKNVQETWSTSLSSKCKHIRTYFKDIKKKSELIENEFKVIFQECKEASDFTKSTTPKILVVFKLLMKHFEEKDEDLYIIVNKDLPDDEIPLSAKTDYPILIIKGDSLYDEESISSVVIEKKIVIRCNNNLQGILITFLAYYIFGFSYSPKLEKTLEFIQRFFLKINPKTAGSKKSSQSKRRQKNYDTAVFNLAKSLTEFSSEFETNEDDFYYKSKYYQ